MLRDRNPWKYCSLEKPVKPNIPSPPPLHPAKNLDQEHGAMDLTAFCHCERCGAAMQSVTSFDVGHDTRGRSLFAKCAANACVAYLRHFVTAS